MACCILFSKGVEMFGINKNDCFWYKCLNWWIQSALVKWLRLIQLQCISYPCMRWPRTCTLHTFRWKICVGETIHMSKPFIFIPPPFCPPDSLFPVQPPRRRTPPPPPLHPPPPPLPPPQRQRRRSFYPKTPSCLCTPAAQWPASRRASSSLLQDKVTHTHTHPL